MKNFCFYPSAIASVLLLFLCFPSSSFAKEKNALCSPLADTIKESKVDYLEKIYFSGGTKEDLTNSILITLQEVEQNNQGKTVSPSVLAQMMFLTDIKGRLEGAKDACAVTDMLAAGIYTLDVSEAVAQGISRPSPKTSLDLNSIISKTQSVSSGAGALASNAYVLSNGKFNGLGLSTKMGTAANTVGSTINTAKQVADVASGLKDMFGKKDKACKAVPVKVIALCTHPSQPVEKITVQTTQTITNTASNSSTVSTDKKTIITITGIDYEKLTTIEQNIKACASVKSTSKKFNTTQSVIEVMHTGSTDDLLGLMLQTCKSNFKQGNIANVEEGAVAINLAAADVKKPK